MSAVKEPFRCLIVDDSPVNSRILAVGLQRAFEDLDRRVIITMASCADSGIDYWRQMRFDLTIMDYHMPEKNGDEAAREILAIDGTALIVGYTSSEDEEVERCLGAGMKKVFPKDVVKVTKYVEKLLKKGIEA